MANQAVRVLFRAQGNSERQPGYAVARRGSKLLIQYRIQNGEERERFISKDRYEVVEGDVAGLPVDAAPVHARKFKVTLPDGRVRVLSGARNQDRAAVTYSIAKRWFQDEVQAAKFPHDHRTTEWRWDGGRRVAWGFDDLGFKTREAAEEYLLESTAQYANGGYERVVVEVTESGKHSEVK